VKPRKSLLQISHGNRPYTVADLKLKKSPSSQSEIMFNIHSPVCEGQTQVLKSHISELTQFENEHQALTGKRIDAVRNRPGEIDVFLSKSIDPNEMLSKMERGLKTCQYSLDRIVRNGFEHFVKLTVTTQDEYNARLKATQGAGKVPRKNIIEIFDANPVNAVLVCEGRKGPVKIFLQGVPSTA